MLRLLWRIILVFYPFNPSTCLTLHPSPIPSHPHIPLGGDDHFSVVPCLAVGQYTGILVLRQFLKIEQTLSPGCQIFSLLIIKHITILIGYQPTLSVLVIITLFISPYICVVFYAIHPLLLSRPPIIIVLRSDQLP
jgi:hypothetical protein